MSPPWSKLPQAQQAEAFSPSSGHPGTLFLPFQPFQELFVLCPGALGAWGRMLSWLDAAFPSLCPCPWHRGCWVSLGQTSTGVTSPHPDNLPSALSTGLGLLSRWHHSWIGFVPNQTPSDAGAPSAGREGLGYQRQSGYVPRNEGQGCPIRSSVLGFSGPTLAF